MWNFASECVAGNGNLRSGNAAPKPPHDYGREFSDDEALSSSAANTLECPICCESFNVVENVPYVLWCGHSLCKNCILGLQWAIVKIPPSPLQLPLLISCPWCNLLSPRLVCRGKLKFPRKNYFLLSMVEKMHKPDDGPLVDCRPVWPAKLTPKSQPALAQQARSSGLRSYLQRSLLFFVELTAKFPLVLMFLLIVLYAIPASAAVFALYVVITVLFGLPSFLILYFAYPSLDWLVKEIVA